MALFSFMQAQEKLDLDVIAYDLLVENDVETMETLRAALHTKGIVGVSGIPGYREKVEQFVAAAREFSLLPTEVKETYAPRRGTDDTFLGYEEGKEKFFRDGRWIVEDKKVSYYAHVPDDFKNRWPTEVDLQSPYLALGQVMQEVGEIVMKAVDLTGPKTGISLNDEARIGRMLHYKKSLDSHLENPYWCGAHYDHSLFTALTPSTYFLDGEEIAEPEEAGLFVRVGDTYLKVDSNRDVLMFQVGEFGQLASNDGVQATEHRVHKAEGQVERYAMALFTNPPMDTVIYSTSTLTEDPRYGGVAGQPCMYRDWNERTFQRFIVK